jgi:peptidoglycan/LPS O-acetylase OafA/YrhL
LLQWLGRYSYGMYVYQNLLLYGMVGILTPAILADATGSHSLGRCSYVAIMSLLTAGVAWLSWQLFESRCLAWKRYFSSHQGEKTHQSQLASGGAEETERQAIA